MLPRGGIASAARKKSAQLLGRLLSLSSKSSGFKIPAANASISSHNILFSNNKQGVRWHGGGPGPDAPTVQLTFVNPDDSEMKIAARVGETLLQSAHRTGIEMEGACEGVCACSTCHVILQQDMYDNLLDKLEDAALSEDEEDMLDMAFGLSHTSRLGCQITVTDEMDGAVVTLPKATRNFYVDGHKPTPH
ncbi:hypothetical protein ACHAWC_007703 [Mediolabrus comicus]